MNVLIFVYFFKKKSDPMTDLVSLWSSGKSWQADGNLHLYRTDYLVTDHLAGKFLQLLAL